MGKDYSSLIAELKEFYIGEIRSDILKQFFREWAANNGIEMPKHIKLLKDTAYNSEGDIIPIIRETKNEIYYNDNFHRYCYLNKSEEHIWFEYM